jgi:hypothetical protein
LGYGIVMSDPTNDDRLEGLEEEIDRTRRQAQEADIIEDPEEPKFHETGELSDIDDQAIAPG